MISFDLDNTLWDIEPVLEQAEAAVMHWFEQHAPKLSSRFDNAALQQRKLAIWQQRPELHHQISELRRLTYYQALRDAGYDDSQSAQLAAQAFAHFLNYRHRVKPYDDVLQMLQQLSEHFRLGVLTNGNADISKLPLGDYFDFSFCAEQLNASKPDSILFEAAIADSQCRPEQLLHIGDDPVCDVIGARNAGCIPVWYNPQQQVWSEPGPAPLTVTRLLAIPQLLQQHFPYE